jgi:hypothetical protein
MSNSPPSFGAKISKIILRQEGRPPVPEIISIFQLVASIFGAFLVFKYDYLISDAIGPFTRAFEYISRYVPCAAMYENLAFGQHKPGVIRDLLTAIWIFNLCIGVLIVGWLKALIEFYKIRYSKLALTNLLKNYRNTIITYSCLLLYSIFMFAGGSITFGFITPSAGIPFEEIFYEVLGASLFWQCLVQLIAALIAQKQMSSSPTKAEFLAGKQ